MFIYSSIKKVQEFVTSESIKYQPNLLEFLIKVIVDPIKGLCLSTVSEHVGL